MGLILKCIEIREKMNVWKGGIRLAERTEPRKDKYKSP